MIKVKRKLHNKIFKHDKLDLIQYSVVNEDLELECYYSKWFLTLVFIPVLTTGSMTDGFIRTFKMLIDRYREPYNTISLTKDELHNLTSK